MVNCAACVNPITRSKPGIFCDGCKKGYHAVCVTKSTDIIQLIETIPGLFWKCPDCVKNCILLDTAGVQNILESQLKDAVISLQTQIKSIKSDVIKFAEAELSTGQLKYSDVLKDKSQPAVVIHPKNSNQPQSKTKADILRNINPLEENMQLAKIKNIKDGGILISCKTKAENDKLKSIVQQRMSGGYNVREVGGFLQRIRIVGMTENYTSEDLRNYLFALNVNIFSEDSECKIVKIFPTRKNASIFQAIIQVDKLVYERLLNAGNVFVAYDSCSIYDAFEVYRCFRCNDFNHSAQRCTNAISCPICAEGHELKDCKSNKKKCSNCLRLNNSSITVDHAVWERDKCSAYNNLLNKMKSNITTIK